MRASRVGLAPGSSSNPHTHALANRRYGQTAQTAPAQSAQARLSRIRATLAEARRHIEDASPQIACPLIQRLHNSLDYTRSPETALGLRRLYLYVLAQIEDGNFPEACRVLLSLEKLFQD